MKMYNNIFKFNAFKIWNYVLLKISYKLKLIKMPTLPIALDIEPNNWCNFKCDHCQVTHWDKEKAKLSLDKFKSIIDMFPNLMRVKVQGMGEPFLHESSIEMLEELNYRNIRSTTTSNAQIMSEDLKIRLAKLDSSKIVFSLDAGNKELFEKIRVNSNFEKVTENIKSLIEKNPDKDVTAWAVLTKENIRDYKSILELAKYIGIKKIVFQTFLTNWGKEEMSSTIDAKALEKDSAKDIKENALKIAKNLGLSLEFFQENFMTKEKPCFWPWYSMYIDASGEVIPCCVIADSDTMSFGNILKKSIQDIWNGEEYKNFRIAHRDYNIPDVCKGCYGI